MEPTPRRERSSSRKLLRYAPFVGIVLAVVLIWLLFGRVDDDNSSSNPTALGRPGKRPGRLLGGQQGLGQVGPELRHDTRARSRSRSPTRRRA